MYNQGSQKGNQNIFIAMFILLLVLVFAVLSFAKDLAFQTLKDTAPTKENIQKLDLRDGLFVDVSINDILIHAEVARSKAKIARGLSEVDFLDKNDGMLFVFSSPGVRPFWNNKTLIPLDLLWVNNGEVVHVVNDLPVYDGFKPITETSLKNADFVLEVNGGFIKKNNIKIGDKISILRK